MKKLISALSLFALPLVSFASVGITLSGGSVTVMQGAPYVEPGYSAFSTFDGDITGWVSASNVDTSTFGSVTRFYDVTDSNLDTASASRSITIVGSGAGMLWCSGPMAPGWVAGTVGGGCGGQTTSLRAGDEDCPAWLGRLGCTKKM